MQERARPDLAADLVADARHLEPVERPHGGLGLALRVAKGREIMAANQHLRRLAHRRRVELSLDPPNATAIERRRGAAIEDAVDIEPVDCVPARVKIFGRRLGVEDGDRPTDKVGVERFAQPKTLPLSRRST